VFATLISKCRKNFFFYKFKENEEEYIIDRTISGLLYTKEYLGQQNSVFGPQELRIKKN
jgi:hypothetical protein